MACLVGALNSVELMWAWASTELPSPLSPPLPLEARNPPSLHARTRVNTFHPVQPNKYSRVLNQRIYAA